MEFVKYEENNNYSYAYYTDEEIKKLYSSKKFKITEKYLNFLNKFSHLWLDYKYSQNYLITPLKNALLKMEYQLNPNSSHTAMFINMTQPLLLDNFFRLSNGHNIIKTYFGDTGSGKSMSVLNECFLNNLFCNEILCKDTSYTKDNIVFSREELMELVSKTKDLENHHIDEDNEGILGVGSFSSHVFRSRFEKTLRSKGKNFYNLSPNLTVHNEHYIVNNKGFNDDFMSNKYIFRERNGIFMGYGILQNFKSNKYKRLVKDYLVKKRDFQDSLENQKGDDKRLIRLLNISVDVIRSFNLNIKMSNTFKLYVNSKYHVSVQDSKDIVNLMKLLLDSRSVAFKDFKDQVKDFVIPFGTK